MNQSTSAGHPHVECRGRMTGMSVLQELPPDLDFPMYKELSHRTLSR